MQCKNGLGFVKVLQKSYNDINAGLLSMSSQRPLFALRFKVFH